MKKLLDCFEYLKRYHSDILEALGIMLELFILKKECPDSISSMIELSRKRKCIKDSINIKLRELVGEHFIRISSSANIAKILKMLESSDTTLDNVESFLHIISQKKTTNKLYYYSTPKEVNALLAMLLELEEGDLIYNPCYGMGSIFLSLGRLNTHISLYGEELDERLFSIANLISRFSDISETRLIINDILKQVVFKENNAPRTFDKVICNPPLYAHMGIEQLKEDERFSRIGILAKNYPELVFLTHALSHLKHRGVFIVRNQTLQKGFLEEKFRQKLVDEKMLEAIIELPKNIFPHRSSDFSILVISHNNDNILHINANHSHFFSKDGKYNRLINIQKINDIFRQKIEGDFSKITSLHDINIHDLRASSYLSLSVSDDSVLKLGDMDIEVFRGQRVYGSNRDSEIDYYDIGIADFAICGFSSKFNQQRHTGDSQKIHKYRLRKYDILLSLRGIVPKMAILGKNVDESICVANAGILILRAKSKQDAIGLYCYLFSQKGFEALCKIYEKSGERAIYSDELLELQIPHDYLECSEEKMDSIESLRIEFEVLNKKLSDMKNAIV